MTKQTPEQLLQQGLEQLSLELDSSQQQALLQHLKLIQKWSSAYNLTAILNVNDMVIKHLLDSLAVSAFLHGDNILDVGSGAGLPGIPLAIANPDKHFNLLDSNGKKVRFMQNAAHELGLNNVTVTKHRIENYAADSCFSSIVTRAFGSISQIVELTRRLLCEDGKILAMKANVEQLTQPLPQGYCLDANVLDIPLLAAQRHLVIISEEKNIG